MKKIKAMIIDICKKNVVFRKMIRFFRLFFKKLNYLKYKLKYKVDDKTIFFEVYDGRNYTCSPKAIYEKILTMKEFKDFKFVWAFVDPSKHDVLNDKRLTIVKTNSKDYYKYLSIFFLIFKFIITKILLNTWQLLSIIINNCVNYD